MGQDDSKAIAQFIRKTAKKEDIILKDMAAILAHTAGTKVVFELPDEVERGDRISGHLR